MAFATELDELANAFGGSPIAEHDAAEPRYPMALVIDVSGSTAAVGADGISDIDKINQAVASIYQALRQPPAGDPLELTNHQVDLCIIAYSSEPSVILPWTAAPDLPAIAPLLSPQGGTATGKALLATLDVCLARMSRYKKDGLPKCGQPNIFHLTDGGANDVAIGTAQWHQIESRMKILAPKAQDRKGLLYHFVSPSGYLGSSGGSDAQGRPMSGADLLGQWFGTDSVIPLAQGTAGFQRMAELVVKTITAVSRQAADNREIMTMLKVQGIAHAA